MAFRKKFRCRPSLVQRCLQLPGEPLASDVRDQMEATFGSDLSEVRVHCGVQADAATKLLKAKAFARGSHIVFGDDLYAPATPDGLWLLAHELAHVLQQREGLLVRWAISSAPDLEHEACEIADLVAAGGYLPADFRVKAFPFGTIQCHKDEPCPGKRVPAVAKELYLAANQAIELAYKYDPRNVSHADSIFFGSSWDGAAGRDILPPRGVKNSAFARALLRNLRGLVKQRRPDIIDFELEVFYEIKTTAFVPSGNQQKESYYIVAQTLMEGNFRYPPWKDYAATWYPPHVLTLPGDRTGKLIVCTEATDHKRWPGLLLYEVRKIEDEDDKEEKRQVRPAVRFSESGFDSAFGDIRSTIGKELKNAIRVYDPGNPEYVVIVPEKYYKIRWAQQTEKNWDKLRVRPSYDFPGGHALRGLNSAIVGAECLIAFVGAGAVIVAGASVIITAAAAGGATVAAASAGGAAGAGGGEVISLAAYRAALAVAPQAKTLAAAAGVLILLGSVTSAKAASPSVTDVSAIRVVPASDFQQISHVQSASSKPLLPKLHAIGTCSSGFPKSLNLGARVMFDGEPHYIISQATAL